MIDILFKNNDFVAVNKPVGISVHNNETGECLLLLLEKELNVKKLYPVHRLDKETSGIQVFALSQMAAQKLSEEFQNKNVQKKYCAILKGELRPIKGIWNSRLTNKAEGRKNPAGALKDRVLAETQFFVRRSSPFFTFCEFNLITGRRHQIRKHAALSKHEIVGDVIYGIPKYNKKIAKTFNNERLFLHCFKLEILGQIIECSVPKCFYLFFEDSPEIENF